MYGGQSSLKNIGSKHELFLNCLLLSKNHGPDVIILKDIY